VLVAIVVFKTESGVIGGDFAYEGIRSWKTQGGFLVLTRGRHEHIIVPADAFTSAEIRVDKDYESDKEAN
jgi:uncharacterized protein involved in tellurium resistance